MGRTFIGKIFYEDTLMHQKSADSYRENWLKEFRGTRREYSFQKWLDIRKTRKITLGEFLKWLYDDINYLVVWNINLLLQLRAFGSVIKRDYGVSYFQQWWRMAYLAFIVRIDPKRLRTYHLFKPELWQRVKELAFNHHNLVHNRFFGFPHHDELEVFANKLKFNEVCKIHEWYNPEILAVFEKGEISLPADGKFSFPKSDFFVKELAGGMGSGAKKFCYANESYWDLSGNIYSEKEVLRFLGDYSKKQKAILVQQILKNHDLWKGFTNGSLTTCRIVTGRSPHNSDEIIPFFATLRMPTGNGDADNYSQGGIAASVDLQTGVLSSAITSKPICGSFSYDIHPDSGSPIAGQVLPCFKDVIDYAKKIHKKFEMLSVGWDIALTEDGLCVVEGNPTWGSDVMEAPSNIPIADTIYIDWFQDWAEKMRGKQLIFHPRIKEQKVH